MVGIKWPEIHASILTIEPHCPASFVLFHYTTIYAHLLSAKDFARQSGSLLSVRGEGLLPRLPNGCLRPRVVLTPIQTVFSHIYTPTIKFNL